MTPALESGSSKTVSMEDLSGSDVTDELSYVFNEEMEETVEEIVEGILNDIVNHIAMEIDGQLESAEPSQANAKIPDKITSPHRVQSPSSRSLYGASRHHGKAQEEFLLEELEGVVPGIRDRLIPAQEKKTVEGKSEDEETEGDSTEEEGLIKMLPNINLEMLHPLQQHILLYIQVYDTQRILYVLSRLRSILHTCWRDFVCSMSSTSVSSTNTPQLIKLQQLLARHKRCMTGRDFYVELDAEAPASFRSQAYLEILLQTCVYYVRSYYPIEGKAESSEAVSNRDVQISSMEVLELVLQELVGVVRESGRGSATFISDLLMRCKVQKAVLYCLLATVCNAKKETLKGGKTMLEISLDAPVELGNRGAQAFQLQLLKLAQTIIILEDQLFLLTRGEQRQQERTRRVGVSPAEVSVSEQTVGLLTQGSFLLPGTASHSSLEFVEAVPQLPHAPALDKPDHLEPLVPGPGSTQPGHPPNQPGVPEFGDALFVVQ